MARLGPGVALATSVGLRLGVTAGRETGSVPWNIKPHK
jgi:hypothetical protein